MNNLFIGILYKESDIPWLLKNGKTPLQVAANTYQWNIISGMEEGLNNTMDIFSFIPLGSFPKNSRKLFVHTKRSINDHNGLFIQFGYINFYFIKELCRFIYLLFAIRKWINNSPTNSNIFIYSMYSPFLWAVELTKKLGHKKGIKYCLILPDVAGKYGISPSWFTPHGLFYKIDSFFSLWMSRRADYYVFLTEAMDKVININKMPFTVIEGSVSMSQIDEYNQIFVEFEEDKNYKIILYSGSLRNEFGIETLLRAFTKISDRKLELWLCGPQTEAQTVLKYSQIDERIKYLGFLQKEALIRVQRSATVLINPRQDKGEYVKYSFPSKTMEYLLSGKPVVMFKLPGIPEEYFDYVYFIPDSSEESIAKTIMEVCCKSKEELDHFGNSARSFVLKDKNSLVQAKKIIDLISQNSGVALN